MGSLAERMRSLGRALWERGTAFARHRSEPQSDSPRASADDARERSGVRAFTRLPRIRTIKYRLTLLCAAMSLVIIVATFWMLTRTADAVARDEALRRADELTSYFADSIAEAVAANDRLQVHVQAEALARAGVSSVRVENQSGDELYPAAAAASRDVRLREPDRESGWFVVTKPVRFGGRQRGTVSARFNRGALETRVHESNEFVYPILALGLLSTVLLGFAALHSPFHALRRLANVAERIGDGDLSTRVPVEGRDEMAAFCQSFNRMVKRLAEARLENARSHLRAIEAMIRTVEAKDAYTQGHCVRVRDYSSRILDALPSFPSEKRFQIETAALLHDIGKIGVPDRVLLKRGKLTAEEIEIIQRHVTIGEDIVLHLESMREVANWVRHHHERWDGAGYPDRLEGKAIPLASRVIAVADCIDAMLTNRPYRTPRSLDDVIGVLARERGRQFDPEVVDAALKALGASSNSAGQRVDPSAP